MKLNEPNLQKTYEFESLAFSLLTGLMEKFGRQRKDDKGNIIRGFYYYYSKFFLDAGFGLPGIDNLDDRPVQEVVDLNIKRLIKTISTRISRYLSGSDFAIPDLKEKLEGLKNINKLIPIATITSLTIQEFWIMIQIGLSPEDVLLLFFGREYLNSLKKAILEQDTKKVIEILEN